MLMNCEVLINFAWRQSSGIQRHLRHLSFHSHKKMLNCILSHFNSFSFCRDDNQFTLKVLKLFTFQCEQKKSKIYLVCLFEWKLSLGRKVGTQKRRTYDWNPDQPNLSKQFEVQTDLPIGKQSNILSQFYSKSTK